MILNSYKMFLFSNHTNSVVIKNKTVNTNKTFICFYNFLKFNYNIIYKIFIKN